MTKTNWNGLGRIEQVTETGCWIWMGPLNQHGYGLKGGYLAHRDSYAFHKGEIPNKAFICHTCHVRCCVNPDHLYAGDAVTNASDRMRRAFRPWSTQRLSPEQRASALKDHRHPARIAKQLGVSVSTIPKQKWSANRCGQRISEFDVGDRVQLCVSGIKGVIADISYRGMRQLVTETQETLELGSSTLAKPLITQRATT